MKRLSLLLLAAVLLAMTQPDPAIAQNDIDIHAVFLLQCSFAGAGPATVTQSQQSGGLPVTVVTSSCAATIQNALNEGFKLKAAVSQTFQAVFGQATATTTEAEAADTQLAAAIVRTQYTFTRKDD